MKKKVILIGFIFYVVATSSITAQNINAGITFWNNGFTNTSNISGGYYLKNGVSVLTNNIMFSIEYDTNILTNHFQDRLLSVNFVVCLTNNEIANFAIVPSYLCNLSDFDNSQYVGLTIAPINTWKYQFSDGNKIYLCLLPVSIYYGYKTEEFLWAVNFFELRFFF